MTRLTDIEIEPEVLTSARDGDEFAQAAIYAALAPATFALLRRLAGNRALAEDLFQETYISVFQRLPQFRGEAPLGAWVRQIAVSKCLMDVRSPWHRARLRLSTDSQSEAAWGDSLLPCVQGPLAESFDVERGLESLPPTARAVVWLFEVEGYSHEEIARSFGRSTSFSKFQLARAHIKLREWFEPPRGSTDMHNVIGLPPSDSGNRLRRLPTEEVPPYNWQEFQRRARLPFRGTGWISVSRLPPL